VFSSWSLGASRMTETDGRRCGKRSSRRDIVSSRTMVPSGSSTDPLPQLEMLG
jgi:hypothetical protein